jgi:hypothetical protein
MRFVAGLCAGATHLARLSERRETRGPMQHHFARQKSGQAQVRNLTRLANRSLLRCGVSRAPNLEKRSPRKHEDPPRWRAGVPGKRGKISDVAVLILSENLELRKSLVEGQR